MTAKPTSAEEFAEAKSAPGKYTFTALAGTLLHAIAATLAEKVQYLPFDPLLLDAGVHSAAKIVIDPARRYPDLA